MAAAASAWARPRCSVGKIWRFPPVNSVMRASIRIRSGLRHPSCDCVSISVKASRLVDVDIVALLAATVVVLTVAH
eukprot:8756357-Pyramimonas_sp.AAC.1